MIDADRTPGTRFTLSTAQVLSLLTSGIVLSVLVVAIAVTGVTLTRSATGAAQDRLTRGVRQLSAVAVTGLRQTQPRYAAVATDSSVSRLLTADSKSIDSATVNRVRTALERLRLPTDSGMPAELWDASGRRVAYVGDDLPASIALNVHQDDTSPPPGIRPGLDSIKMRDSLQLGQLYHVGDQTYFWVAMPIIANGRTRGFILQQRRIASNPQAEQTIRELSGDSVSGYYRNTDGTVWTTFGGAASAPHVVSNDSTTRIRAGEGELIYAEQRIPGTQLVIGMELPRQSVVAVARNRIRLLGLLAVVLTILAGGLAWIVGRRVAKPLARIAGAADEVARGEYGARVPSTGTFEIARLADNFNRMAAQIGDSRSELERREEELRMVADAIPQLAWMASPEGEIGWLNERWYSYTGSPKVGDHGKQWLAAHEETGRPESARRWRAGVASGQPFEMEVRIRAADGEPRWFLTRAVPVHDREGVITRWLGTSTDIQSLRDAREAAEAASRAKSDFLAAMSHELRTPLNAIGGYAELMQLGIRGPISADQEHDLARIHASQQHLLGLIGSVLDLSRIESGRVTYALEAVSVATLLDSLEPLVAPQAAAKQHTLEFHVTDDDLAVTADRDKLRQIVLNLLSNAIRHTPAGTTIVASANRRGTSMVVISVNDNGPGISADRQASVFEPFVQLDRSLARPSEGIGLGLAISRDLARGMHGDLFIEGDGSNGACFVLLLPIAAEAIEDTTVVAG